MSKIANYAPSKPFLEMSATEKLGFLGKLLIFFSTMGFAYPRLLSHGAQAQPSRKVETPQDTVAPTH